MTQHAPRNLTVLLLNTTASNIRVQWSHSSQGQPSDRYSVIVYNGDIDEHYASASETSVDIHGLRPNGYYLIVVIAIWGSSYGAVYGLFLLSSDPSMYVNYRHKFSF